VIIDEIVNNVRAVDRETVMAPEMMKQIVDACVAAVHDLKRHDCRAREERSVEGPWALHGEKDE
jgi:hypothetical protein